MRHACVLALSLIVVGVGREGWAQSPIRPTVPAAIQVHVRDERFQPVTAVRGLPLGVREELQRLFGSTAMAIADPGQPFQVTDVITDPTLPIRRMSVAACSQDHCLVYYERGGIAHTWHAVLFHWTPDGTRVEAGGTAPFGIRTLDDLRNAVLSGALKGPGRYW